MSWTDAAQHRGYRDGRDPWLTETHHLDTAVLSGGVFQNDLLLADIKALLSGCPIEIWTNREVPANDGGISLGQATFAVR